MAVVSFYILACSGGTYIFGIYSGAVKEELQYTQETLDTLGFFKDIGSSVGIIAGLMNEVLPPWVILLTGAFMNLFGYIMVWLAVTHRIVRPPTWQMNLFIRVGANSQTFANTGVMVTFVKNFPHGRGEVLGILKGFVGLSGALFTQAHHALYRDDARGVIFLIAVLPSFVNLIFMFFIRPISPVYDKRERRNIYHFLYAALFIAAVLLIAILLENQVQLSCLGFEVFGALSVAIVLSVILIGIRAEYLLKKETMVELPPPSTMCPTVMASVAADDIRKTETDSRPLSVIDGFEHRKSQPNAELESSVAEGTTYSTISREAFIMKNRKPSGKIKLFLSNWPERGDNFTILQALLSFDLWAVFVSVSCGVGVTLTAVDNMGQIGESNGYSNQSIATFVSLLSIWNFLRKVSAGFGSEFLLRRFRCPRPLILTLVLATACLGHIMIAFPAANTLYLASIVLGFCFGVVSVSARSCHCILPSSRSCSG
ncbi:hypothetical protein KP509_31G002600 [Ceratopteris richardii]|nr:hypothetical protein KP509_31G002600 [Ceratopteris richardii]